MASRRPWVRIPSAPPNLSDGLPCLHPPELDNPTFLRRPGAGCEGAACLSQCQLLEIIEGSRALEACSHRRICDPSGGDAARTTDQVVEGPQHDRTPGGRVPVTTGKAVGSNPIGSTKLVRWPAMSTSSAARRLSAKLTLTCVPGETITFGCALASQACRSEPTRVG